MAAQSVVGECNTAYTKNCRDDEDKKRCRRERKKSTHSLKTNGGKRGRKVVEAYAGQEKKGARGTGGYRGCSTGGAECKDVIEKSGQLTILGGFLEGNGLLLAHRTDDGDQKILAIVKASLDLLSKFAVRDLDIVLSSTVTSHEVKETVINVDELVFVTLDIGNVHVVGRGRDIFHLLTGEDIDSDKMDLGVAVLAGFGGGHIDDFARAALDNNVAVLAEGRALHWEGQGRTRAGRLKGLIVALIVGHFLC